MKNIIPGHDLGTNNNSLATAIIVTAMRLEHMANHFIFEPLGLTSASVKIIGLLKNHGKLTSGEISELLGSSKPNITQRLNFLQKQGLIRRLSVSGLKDGRKVLVQLTLAGRKKLKIITEIMKERQIHIEKNLPEEDVKNFLNLFKKINEHLDLCKIRFK